MLCLQIFDVPDKLYTVKKEIESVPELAKAGITCAIVYRPDPNGNDVECWICGGKGQLLRGGECRTCAGSGKVAATKCLRVFRRMYVHDAPPPTLLDILHAHQPSHWDTTFECSENGGGCTNTGHSTIVCGLDGQPLPAVWLGHHANRCHAIFWPHAALVVRCSQWRGQGNGTVDLVAVDRHTPYHFRIVEDRLWTFVYGRSGEMEITEVKPHDKISFPSAAVSAAIGKTFDYHCRRAYYTSSRVPYHPSGPKNRPFPKMPLGY